MENVRIPWNDWKVVKQLGKGSYGTVYEIERALGTFTEKAAMKVISIPLDHSAIEAAYVEGYDDESISRLYSNQLEQILDEYRNMEELSGYSNIVTCKDVSVIPHDNAFGWDIYIRMELLTPLMTYLKNNNDIDSEDICRLGIDICNALELCEKREIVHRDVKPENIFVTKDGTFKLGDFGIARTLDHTTQATRAGTERYMAPEVIKREPYGKDVDLYSLGLVLYWLLNNRRMPFLNPNKVPVGDEPNVAQSRRLSGEALPRPVNGSEELQNIVLKACEYNREKRYPSAKEMLQDLTHVSESMKTASDIQPEPMAAPAKESDSNQKKLVGEESLTDSWEEAKTVGKDFLDDDKESEYEEAEEKTITPEWLEEKKSKEQKKNTEHNNQKYEKKDGNKTPHTTEIDNSSSKNEPVPFPETINYTTKPKRFPPLLLFLVGGVIVLGVVVFAAVYSDSNNSSSSSSYSLSKTADEPATAQETLAYTNDSKLEILGEYIDDEDQYVVVKNNYPDTVDIFAPRRGDDPIYYAALPGQEVVLSHGKSGISEISARESSYEGLTLEFDGEYVFENTCNCFVKNPGGEIDVEEQLDACAVFYKNGKVAGVSTQFVSFPYLFQQQSIPVSVEAPVANYDEIRWCFKRIHVPQESSISFDPSEVVKQISATDYILNDSGIWDRVLAKFTNNSPYDVRLTYYISLYDRNNNLIGAELCGNRSLLAGRSRIAKPDDLNQKAVSSAARRELVFFVSDYERVDSTKDLVVENQTDTSVTVKSKGSVPDVGLPSFTVAGLYFMGDQLVSYGYESNLDPIPEGQSKTIEIERYPDADYDRVEWYVFDWFT